MTLTGPKCKFCGETHFAPVCPNIGKRRQPAAKAAPKTKPKQKGKRAKA